MSQYYSPTPPDGSEQFPPTRPEPTQPLPDFSSGPATAALPQNGPTYQTYPAPRSPDISSGYTPLSPFAAPTPATPYSAPIPLGAPTQFGQPNTYGQPTPAQPRYPSPPQYDPRSGQYVQSTYVQNPYGHPVVFQTVVNTPVPVMAPKSVGLAYVLWFFLGGLGIHHFYLGRTGWGVAYLLWTLLLGWTLIGLVPVGIGLLIDLFLIPSHTRTANQRLAGYWL